MLHIISADRISFDGTVEDVMVNEGNLCSDDDYCISCSVEDLSRSLRASRLENAILRENIATLQEYKEDREKDEAESR